VTVAIGALAIWATMGAATPLVVGAGLTAGIGTAAYGASNAGEGIHNIQLGNAGDIHTKSYNRIRDTLFMGNDKLYHQVGGIFVTASSIMIPIGQTQSVVKGLTQFAIGEAGAYTAGQFAYHGTKLLGGSEEDAQTANFIGNIVGGYAVSSAASKFSLNKVKVDVEAPKYNREQILKNLEESRLARESSNFDQYLAKEKFQKTLMGMDPMDRQRYLQWHEYAESGIMVQDRVKLLSWERPVNSKLYLENKAVYDNPKYFDQLTGSENWPGQKGDPNIDGFVKGEYQKTTLSPGDKIDRFGSDYGHFFGNIGESKEMRAMSPNSDFKNYNQYEILMDLPVLKGKIAPWFDQPGGGIQFKLDPFFAKQIMSIPSDETAIIKKLIEFGYLRKL
ncbi:TNT domain-containing protein, partial [Streptococcus mitis]